MSPLISEKAAAPDSEWRHTRTVLAPLNRAYQPIVIPELQIEQFQVLAEFVTVLGR